MQRKFDVNFKLSVVQMYLRQEEEVQVIAEKMGIHHSLILDWVKLYQYHGEAGLKTRSTHKKYDITFKEKVKTEIRKKVSINSLSIKYHISPSTVKRWKVECGMAEEKIISDSELQELRKRFKNTDNPDIKMLMERLEYAKMENDVLKKLGTLVRARKEKERKQSKN